MSEYRNLVGRNFQPYSAPHRALYDVVADMLSYHPAKVLEVGFGIGYGIQQLVQKNCLSYYIGVEPDKDSFDYVEKKIKIPCTHSIFNLGWLETLLAYHDFDFTLCIEVIEHLPSEMVVPFIEKLKRHTKGTLFLSTPDVHTNRHGKFTRSEVVNMLKTSGFKDVVDIEWQIPFTLFICKS
jgi:2-polyprenyl-3-methyl-5-hydroxy-6-metoxy-1,4-benzoquinol methylase